MAITLKAARVNKNMTQGKAAKAIGVSTNTISRWESGKCMPHYKYIPVICEVYGRSYDELIFLPSNYALSVDGE